MTSVDEQQLALAAGVGQNSGSADQRVAQLHGAVQRLNAIAANLRSIASDVDWSGPSAIEAQNAFAALARSINEHADAINLVAGADASTGPILSQAYHDYQGVLSIDTSEGHAYPGSGMVGNERYREMQAQQAREALDTAMIAARGELVSAAAWDLDPPAPAATPGDGGVTGTYPSGVPTTTVPTPGGSDVDPVGPVTGTVPPGSTSVRPNEGGVDPVGPVTGTVPYGSTSTPPDSGAANGGFDPVGPVTGTVPSGSTTGNLVGSDRVAELHRRLG